MTTELAPTDGDSDLARREPEPLDPFAALLEPDKLNQLWRLAKIFSDSTMVPSHFQKHHEDCFIACQMALRLRVDPFMLMQSTYVVHGRPGMEAKLVIALANARGCFKGPIQYDMSGEGESRSCTAFAIHKSDGSRCEMTVSMATARAEGWASKAGSKWKTIPDLMLRYRSASWLVRTYCPEVMVGLMTRDELEDIGPVAVVEPPMGTRTEQLAKRLETSQSGPEQPQQSERAATSADDPDAELEALRKRVIGLMAKVASAGHVTENALSDAGIKSGLAVTQCTSQRALIQAADNLHGMLAVGAT